MAKAFYDQVDDELRGLLGPSYQNYEFVRSGRSIKIWSQDPAIHFEAQHIGRQWGPDGKPVIEVGLHFETNSVEDNEERLNHLTAKSAVWRKELPAAKGDRAFGPQSATWRRLSEVIAPEEFDDPDLAGEIAERLAAYIKNLESLL